jgi:hypothetical protein
MPDEELYDLQSDPHEIRNLATSSNPQDQAELKRLRNVLQNWIKETHDQGETSELPKDSSAVKLKPKQRKKKS